MQLCMSHPNLSKIGWMVDFWQQIKDFSKWSFFKKLIKIRKMDQIKIFSRVGVLVARWTNVLIFKALSLLVWTQQICAETCPGYVSPGNFDVIILTIKYQYFLMILQVSTDNTKHIHVCKGKLDRIETVKLNKG